MKPKSMLGRAMGFSLLEILVATAVFCMLALLLNQIVTPTMSVVSKGRQYFELNSRARAALDLMARDLSQGVYREDLPAFRDTSDQPALAFFTRRAGQVNPGDTPDDYRQLSFVLYRALEQNAGDTHFSLWRGAINVRWDLDGTYPPVNGLDGPMPFSTQTLPVAYATANDPAKSFEPVLQGVVRMEVRFLGDDGLYRPAYNTDPDAGPVSRAVIITLVVTDEKTQDLILSAPDTLATFRQRFIEPAGMLDSQDTEMGQTLGALWEPILDSAAIWNGLPSRARGSVYVFERTVPLR